MTDIRRDERIDIDAGRMDEEPPFNECEVCGGRAVIRIPIEFSDPISVCSVCAEGFRDNTAAR